VLVADHDAYLDSDPDPNAEFARWLNEFVQVRGHLARALELRNGEFNKRFEALYSLARALRFNPDNLGWTALSVLDAMLQPLGDALAMGSRSWIDDVDSDLHNRVCQRATANLPLHVIIDAIDEFRYGKVCLDRTQARNVPQELRAMLAKQLSIKLLKAMNEWRK